jgi:hypothetical protein
MASGGGVPGIVSAEADFKICIGLGARPSLGRN